MLKTLDTYILRSFAANYLISLCALIGLYVTLHLFFNLDEFVEDGPGFFRVIGNMASYYGYNLFLYFAQTSGVITLFAASCTLARMQKSNELIACLASGTSMYRLAAPVIVAGVLTNGLWIIDQEVIIPAIAHKLARDPDDVEGRQTRTLWFVKDRDHALLLADQYFPAEKTMFKMVVLERDADGDLQGVLTADRAVWAPEAGGWRLIRGMRSRPAADLETGFTSRERTLRETADVYRSDLTPDDLLLRQASQWKSFLSLSQLAELQRSTYVDPSAIQRIRHGRFAAPFVNLLLLLLGLPFFLTREPVSVLEQATKCLLNCGLAFVVNFLAQNIAADSTAYPALPAWIPIMVFAPLVVVYMDSVKT